MCQYGNCESRATSITVTWRGGTRERFCCELHAALHLIGDLQKRVHIAPDPELARLFAEREFCRVDLVGALLAVRRLMIDAEEKRQKFEEVRHAPKS
jgi:hypothetical protein